MAETALAILSLEAAKKHLRLDEDADDSLVTQAVSSAVSYVADRTGFPLVNRDVEFEARPSSLDDRGVIALPVRDVRAVRSITYYAAGDTVTGARTGNVDPIPHRYHERQGWTLVSAPAGHWPGGPGSVLPAELDATLQWSVTVFIGYDLGPTDEDIRHAVVLMARQFYEQPELFESSFAVNSILDGIRGRRGIRAAFPPV